MWPEIRKRRSPTIIHDYQLRSQQGKKSSRPRPLTQRKKGHLCASTQEGFACIDYFSSKISSLYSLLPFIKKTSNTMMMVKCRAALLLLLRISLFQEISLLVCSLPLQIRRHQQTNVIKGSRRIQRQHGIEDDKFSSFSQRRHLKKNKNDSNKKVCHCLQRIIAIWPVLNTIMRRYLIYLLISLFSQKHRFRRKSEVSFLLTLVLDWQHKLALTIFISSSKYKNLYSICLVHYFVLRRRKLPIE
jgi:hypothetical protein